MVKIYVMQEIYAIYNGMNNLYHEGHWVCKSTYLPYILASKMYLQG